MADDLRQRVSFAASLTILGLLADLAYMLCEAAARFALIHRWPESAAYFILGVVSAYLAFSRAASRAEQEARRDR
ncbi:hypothetical protein ACIBHX_01825 [Nonomuraea sp. NPDC050536]|uniref:hypothetical protein n=1 Tax=Nonomuraea sp. NPDC050536 TaxID=3364366 RepID=UPI0037C6ECAB